jgi:hypothetical protein
MLKSMRSRRMPATQTTPSMRPQLSMALCTIRSPAAMSVTESALATAMPPAARISATTASATSLDGSSPCMPTPKSATTTFGALGGAQQRHGSTDAAPGARHDDCFSVEYSAHVVFPLALRLRSPLWRSR